MKMKHYIDTHKGLTGPFVLGLMAWFDQWDNATAWVYLALHGTYGVLWVMKSRIFPDKNWERRARPVDGLVIWVGLSLYWIAPFLITSQGLQAPAWLVGTCVSMYVFGVFFHFTSDMQKDVTLELKRGLITSRLWARSRNPNYFGELLIYLGFSALAMHWAPIAALAVFVVLVWVPNMRRKDKSISRHDGWDEYKAASNLIFPRVFGGG